MMSYPSHQKKKKKKKSNGLVTVTNWKTLLGHIVKFFKLEVRLKMRYNFRGG